MSPSGTSPVHWDHRIKQGPARIAVWNYWSIILYLQSLDGSLAISAGLKRRWIYSYVLAAVIVLIGVITLLFMLRVT